MLNRPSRPSVLAASVAGALAFAALAPSSAFAQGAQSAERPTFRPMRYDENWRALADPGIQTDALDVLKWIEVSETVSLTLGGEARLRGEAYDDQDLGFNEAGDNDYLLGRLMLHADVRAGRYVRGFVQLRVGDAWGAKTRWVRYRSMTST